MENEESESTNDNATSQGVCDGIPCNFYTSCLPYNEVQQLCKDHEANHPGHNTSIISC